MPTPECWSELGALDAKVDHLIRTNEEYGRRIRQLETERTRIKTVGGVMAFVLTGLGVFFAEPIKAIFTRILFG